MACEVVPIATRVGGVPEVIDHGVSGFLAEVGDVDTMARYAIDLLSDENRLREMGRRPRRWHSPASAPARSSRNTKTSTAACWSARRRSPPR